MNLLKKIDWNVLNTYIEQGLIFVNKHKLYDLWILNYSKTVTYEKLWDDYTLACRGLVIDGDGNIIARPFSKFKNFEEHDIKDINLNQDYEIFEKMDGSLGILFYYGVIGKWMCATRGSFDSEQAICGMEILNNKLSIENWNSLNKDITYLFEIIYPENRIVVDYDGLSDMVLLGMIETSSGDELPYSVVKTNDSLFTVVKRYEYPKVSNLGDLREYSEDNREGFVIRFADGFRVKVKFLDYCRLHSIITNVSTTSIWEMMKAGKNLSDILENVPDEFYNFVKKVMADLTANYYKVEDAVLDEFAEIYFAKGKFNRRDFATEAMKSKNSGYLFMIYDGRDYSDLIWKQIRPVWSKPFKIIEE